jgi:hypothetical protein
VKLTDAQHKQVHLWIAQGLDYSEMEKRMITEWGYACKSQNISWHRKHYAQEIQRMRMESQAQERRRERDRLSKQLHRSGITLNSPHCATCQCHALSKAG